MLPAVVLVLGVPQGLNNLALQNAVFHQADAERMGSSAGLLRTFGYLGAIIASAADGAFFGQRADTSGLHHLAVFMLTVSGLFLALTVIDGSLRRIGAPTDDDTTTDTEPPGQPPVAEVSEPRPTGPAPQRPAAQGDPTHPATREDRP
jgi:hypothetical protein